jgi:hypothetical protein
MSKPLIQYITSDSGDWAVLRVKTDEAETEYSGHSIGFFVWLEVMRDYLKCDIEMKCISDEDMENENY